MNSNPVNSSVSASHKPPRLLGGFIVALGLLILVSGIGMLSLTGSPVLLICGALIAAGGGFTFAGSKIGLYLHLAGILPMFVLSAAMGGLSGAFLGGLLIHGLLIFFTIRENFLRD